MEEFILLPTGKPANRHQLVICQDGSLWRTHNHHNQVYPSQPAQHLYQLSKEDVKTGDWFIDYHYDALPGDLEMAGEVEGNKVYILDGGSSYINQEHIDKVIASTDLSCHLPPIPEETIQAFIQWYNSK